MSPILFNLFINDLQEKNINTKILEFADVIVLFYTDRKEILDTIEMLEIWSLENSNKYTSRNQRFF